ncbi:MAG: hypothetical protein ACTILD_10060 [Pseudoalteromonas sp.]
MEIKILHINHSILKAAQKALFYQCIGVDKEKTDELESMLTQEYQKGREQLDAEAKHDKG